MRHRIETAFLIVACIALAAVWTPPARAETAPDPCLGADWDAIGYRDGARGLETAFEGRAAECAIPPEPLDWARYDEGYADGLRVYCTPENGYRVGKLNLEYFGVCPPLLEPAFLAAYRRGLRDWAVAHGYDGYWYGGVVVYHYLLPRKVFPLVSPHRPPKPRPLHWRDRGGDWDVATRPAPDSILDRDPKRDFRTDRDWRRLWDRTPRARPPERTREPPAARIDPDRPAAPPPRTERTERRDRDYDDDRWSGDYAGPRPRREPPTLRQPGGAWRPGLRTAPPPEPPEEPEDGATRRLPRR